MDAKEMEARIKMLENQVRTLQDIEDIKNLQKAYGFYLEHWMAEEIVDLFSDSPDAILKLVIGSFVGKESISRYFRNKPDFRKNPEFMHQLMQLSGVVNVDAAGRTATGRWYGFGAHAVPRGKGVRQFFLSGIYEARYIKEDGKWKFLELSFNPIYSAPPATGWVKPERVAAVTDELAATSDLKPDRPRGDFRPMYPSGYIAPISFKHPVTGKETSEKKRNDALNLRDPR
jgi:hypothetical protein